METKYVYKMWEHTGWGDAIGWMDFGRREIHGHLYRIPEKGDEVQAKMQSGNIGRFEVVSVKRMLDPKDQFFATVRDLGFVETPDCCHDGCLRQATANIFVGDRIACSVCEEHGPGAMLHFGPDSRAETVFPIGPLGEPQDERAWQGGTVPCGPCGRGEHRECKGEFENLAGTQQCWCPVCSPPSPKPWTARSAAGAVGVHAVSDGAFAAFCGFKPHYGAQWSRPLNSALTCPVCRQAALFGESPAKECGDVR